MCSIESIGHISHLKKNKFPQRRTSLKLIEKRLNHLREDLQNLTRKELINHQQPITDSNDDHHTQYKKRLDQLLRLYEKQVGEKTDRISNIIVPHVLGE